MARADFTAAEFAGRQKRLGAALAAAGLDGLVVIHPASIHWLTGSEAKSYQEFQCLLVSAAGGPVAALVRAGEVAELAAEAAVPEVAGWGGGIVEDPIAALAGLARRHGLLGRRIGLEVPAYYLHPYHHAGLVELFGAARVVDATRLVGDLRLVKSPAELGYIREAAALADLGMAEFRRRLRPGASELELAGHVTGTLLMQGSGIAASPINLVSGPRAAYSHGAPTRRRLAAGDAGSIELGATAQRYTATLGRQFVLGPPGARLLALYDVVRRAGDAMLAAIRPGVPAVAVHEAACAVLATAGLDRYRVHLSGYGLGAGFAPSWAEPLLLFEGSPHVLEAGMVVTIEPPVFIAAERMGVRLIDNAIVTETGAALLARDDRGLIVVD